MGKHKPGCYMQMMLDAKFPTNASECDCGGAWTTQPPEVEGHYATAYDNGSEYEPKDRWAFDIQWMTTAQAQQLIEHGYRIWPVRYELPPPPLPEDSDA